MCKVQDTIRDLYICIYICIEEIKTCRGPYTCCKNSSVLPYISINARRNVKE